MYSNRLLFIYRIGNQITLTYQILERYNNRILLTPTEEIIIIVKLMQLGIGERTDTWYTVTELQWNTLLNFCISI